MSLLRVVLVALWTALVFSGAVIANLLTGGRRKHTLINTFAPLWGRPGLWLLGVRLRVIGREHLQQRAQIVVINHASILDMLIAASICPHNYTALAKAEFQRIPFFGACFRAFGFPFVERGNTEAARASLRVAAAQVVEKQRSVIIFPEGTRTRDGKLLPFKTGAFHLALATRCPMVPIVFYGAFALSRPGSWRFRPGEVVAVIHPPMETAAWTEDQLRSEAAALHQRYADWLSQPPP